MPRGGKALNRQTLVGYAKTEAGTWDVIGWKEQGGHSDIYDVYGPQTNDEPNRVSTMKVSIPGFVDSFNTELEVYKTINKFKSQFFLKLITWGHVRKMNFNNEEVDNDKKKGRRESSLHRMVPFMILEKLPISLAEFRKMAPTLNLPMKLAVQLGLGCFDALRQLHSWGFVHCHVTPENFMLRLGRDKHLGSVESSVVLIDFGMAQRWPRPPQIYQDFEASIKYASLRLHRFHNPGPVDDLWSLLYMMVEWCVKNGKLPWADNDDVEEVYQQKKNRKIWRSLMAECPKEFHQIEKDLSSLSFLQDPPASIRNHLLSCLKALIEDKDPSWLI